MAMIAKKRRCASEFATVESLEHVFEEYLSSTHTRDMSEVFAEFKKSVSWKTAPVPGLLAEHAPLYEKLVEICPNAVLPPKRTSMALMAVHKRKPINFSTKSVENWADEMGAVIRAGCSKFRALFDDHRAYIRCMSKVQLRLKVYRPKYYRLEPTSRW